jgi:hypothetical protein
MKRLLLAWTLPLIATLLTACGAPPPADFGGNWQPVNRFQDKPLAIPLSPAYAYYASPLDGTLRHMLRRWADDNAMPLVWHLDSDYTLYKAVADLRTTDLQTAISQLNQIYAAEGVSITADAERILVQPPSAGDSPAPPAQSTSPTAAASSPGTDDTSIAPAQSAKVAPAADPPAMAPTGGGR